jgi:TRAP-type C4-dicarboxylate transport system substrate-binding protein
MIFERTNTKKNTIKLLNTSLTPATAITKADREAAWLTLHSEHKIAIDRAMHEYRMRRKKQKIEATKEILEKRLSRRAAEIQNLTEKKAETWAFISIKEGIL